MSTKDLINAIVLGDAIEIENAFQSTMAEKISARLDDMRVDVAQNMFKVQESVEELDEQYVVYNHDGKYNKIKKVVTNLSTANKHAEKLGGDHKVASMQHWQDKLAPKTNEEVELDEEQLDELSKTTLGSYIKKAGQHRVRLAGAERDLDDKDTALQRAKHGADDATYDALSKAQDTMRKQRYKVSDKSQQRAQGISQAVKRLTKEEVEEILASEEFAQLDELSKTTLGSYIKKSRSDAARKSVLSQKQAETGDYKGASQTYGDAVKRMRGARKAEDKLAKEDVEQLVVTTVESALYALEDGRNVLDEQIVEAVSSSSKDNYEWTHSKKPKGHGNWYFSTVHPRQHDFDKHKDETVNVSGTFGDAAKKAQAHFKEKGHKGEIHVLT